MGLLGLGDVLAGSIDERTSTCRRCLERCVGDIVGNAAVNLVTQSGEHWNRCLGHSLGDSLAIEHGQIRSFGAESIQCGGSIGIGFNLIAF